MRRRPETDIGLLPGTMMWGTGDTEPGILDVSGIERNGLVLSCKSFAGVQSYGRTDAYWTTSHGIKHRDAT